MRNVALLARKRLLAFLAVKFRSRTKVTLKGSFWMLNFVRALDVEMLLWTEQSDVSGRHGCSDLYRHFFFGPGLRVPFNLRAFSTCGAFQSLTAFPLTSFTLGAAIFRVAIQCCKVARGIFVILATWTVV
jgi:hypothetical protein